MTLIGDIFGVLLLSAILGGIFLYRKSTRGSPHRKHTMAALAIYAVSGILRAVMDSQAKKQPLKSSKRKTYNDFMNVFGFIMLVSFIATIYYGIKRKSAPQQYRSDGVEMSSMKFY